MRHGVHIFLTEDSIAPGDLAHAAEERGFESLWMPEHTHVPVERRTPYPTGDLPPEYARVFDPFIALTAAAGATTRIGLGLGVCLLPQHDPITLAKTVATLDQVSSGRVLLGTGLGWIVEEMLDHGVEPRTRRSLAREKLLVMQGLWTHDEFEFSGRFEQLSRSWSWPKPVQKPLPILMGGAGGPLGIRHTVELAQGWMPDLSVLPQEKLAKKLGFLAAECEAQGRDPASVELTLMSAAPDQKSQDAYRDLGASRCVYLLKTGSADVVHRQLDQLANELGSDLPA